MDFSRIDQKALRLAKDFKKAEAELLEVICEVDRAKVYRQMGYSSLFQYCVKRLGLSESQAYCFMAVARKSREVPQIKKSIKEGKLTVSKAKRITAVVTKDNHSQWINLAATSNQKKVEREVALAKPHQSMIEKVKYISPLQNIPEKVQLNKNLPQVKLEIGISEKNMLRLRRAQDILSQKQKRCVNLEATIEALLDDFLPRKDPVEKAKRQKMRGKLGVDRDSIAQSETFLKEGYIKDTSAEKVSEIQRKRRKAIPARIKHQIYLKAQGQCMATDLDGKRCHSKRFLEIHHIEPVSKGGKDSIENLILLCSGHHAVRHHSQ